MNGKPFTGISVIKDSAGNTVKEIAIVNGKQNGYDIQYKDGKPISKFLYKNGVKEGISLIYSLRDYTLYQEVSYNVITSYSIHYTKLYDIKHLLIHLHHLFDRN